MSAIDILCRSCGIFGGHDPECAILRQRATVYDNTLDSVFRDRDGWWCIVNGRRFGAWACKEHAVAGFEVEQRRLKRSFPTHKPT